MSLSRVFGSEIFKNVSIVFSGNSIARGLGVITTWILVRHLTPKEYGVFSVIDMVTGFSAGVMAAGLNWSMIKSIAAYRNQPAKAWFVARTTLKVELVYGLILAFGIYLSADFLSLHFFHKAELQPYIKLCSLGVLGAVLFSYRSSIFQAFSQFKLDAAFNISQSGVYLIIIILLLAAGLFIIRTVSIVYVCLPLGISGFSLVLLKKNLTKGQKEHFPNYFSSLGVSYGWLLCYTLCIWLSGQVHMIVLTRYFPLQEIGLYGFSCKIYGISLMLMDSLKVVLLPTYSKILDKAALNDMFKKVLRVTAVISVCFLLLIPFLGMFVKLFAGDKYIGSTTSIQIFVFGAAASTLLSPSVNVLLAMDKFKLIAIGGIILATTNLLGHLTITRNFGANGAAFTQVMSYLSANLYFTIAAYRQTAAVNGN